MCLDYCTVNVPIFVSPTEAFAWSVAAMKTLFAPRKDVVKEMGTDQVRLLPVPVIVTAAKLTVHWLLLTVPLPMAEPVKLPPAWFK